MRIVLLSIVFMYLNAHFSLAQQAPDKDQRAEMRRQYQLIGPGPEHKKLMSLSGTWQVKMLMGPKDMGFNGTASASAILGDRFLVIHGEGMPSGRKSEFRYTIGFDRRHDEYVLQNLDSSGTYPVSARGKATETAIRMLGTDDDPMMKKMGFGLKKFAFDLKIKSDDEFFIETIYIDTRSKPEKFRPAFRYVFSRKMQ